MGTEPHSRPGRVLYVVSTWIPEDQLEAWNRWHSEVHIPQIMAQPEIQGARKYRVVSDNLPSAWQPQYLTIYELESLEGWDSYNTSAATARLRQDYADHYGGVSQIARQVLIEEGHWTTDDGR